MESNLKAGIEGKQEITVTFEHTATAYGSGTVEVFATPAMIALMEQTAMMSVQPYLADGEVTVGTEVSVKHFRATLPGRNISCTSTLIAAEGRNLVFELIATEAGIAIGKGTHTRYIVDKQKFISDLL